MRTEGTKWFHVWVTDARSRLAARFSAPFGDPLRIEDPTRDSTRSVTLLDWRDNAPYLVCGALAISGKVSVEGTVVRVEHDGHSMEEKRIGPLRVASLYLAKHTYVVLNFSSPDQKESAIRLSLSDPSEPES